MATVYKIELTSHWVNFSEKEIKEILDKAVIKTKLTKDNEITIKVDRQY